MRDKLQEIHEALVGNFAAKFKEGNWWGHDTDLGEQKEAFDQAAQAILDLLDRSLPKQLDPKPARNELQDAEVIGYNTALMDVRTVIREQAADVRKVIKETSND